MSKIALAHGGTIDKFVGDAMLIFFGDPETKGDAEDAKACLRMAIEMQDRIAGLNAKWRNAGIELPFRVRMGINSGYCNVGNFGSDDRMDYTIIGAEANLAARLQSVAEPGHIVVSYETYALVRDIIVAHELPPITMKGISREVVPYAVDGVVERCRRDHCGLQRAPDRPGFLSQRQTCSMRTAQPASAKFCRMRLKPWTNDRRRPCRKNSGDPNDGPLTRWRAAALPDLRGEGKSATASAHRHRR